MTHPLDHNISNVRRRARWIIVAAAIGWSAAALLAVLLVLAATDYLIRWHDPGMRMIWSLLAIAAIGWAIYRCLAKSISCQLTNVDVAQRIERRFPELGDRLSMAVEFLDQDEDAPYAGSAVLRRTVVTSAVSDIEGLNLHDVINVRPLARAASAALVVCAIIGALVLFDLTAVAVSIARLANPLGQHDWPREYHLRLVDPPRQIAAGATFEVEVVEADGQLPDDVEIEYRYDDRRSTAVERQPFQPVEGTDLSRMVARKDMVTRPFSYRAVGGDDHTMAWTRLKIVEPSRIESLDVQLHPPSYTSLRPHKSNAEIRALVGTGIEIDAAVTKPLAAAWLIQENGSAIPAQVSTDGRRFSIAANEFVINESNRYWFKLEGRGGLRSVSRDRWQVEALRDAPPKIVLEDTSQHRFVISQAVLPVRALVNDDLAIAQVDLVFRTAQQAEDDAQVVPLMRGPTVAAQPDKQTGTARPSDASHAIRYEWDLAPLKLEPGTTLAVSIRAADYVPQWGERDFPGPVTIIDAAQLDARLAKRQTTVLKLLATAIELQRQARGQAISQQPTLLDLARIEKEHVDSLHATERKQRQVAATLTDEAQGVIGEVDRLLAQIEINRLDRPVVVEHLLQLRQQIVILDTELLSMIRAGLTTAIKTATATLARPTATGPAVKSTTTTDVKSIETVLQGAIDGQADVITILQRHFDELAQLLGYRDFVRQLAELRRDQLELQHDATSLGATTITRRLAELNDRERGKLLLLAGRQADLAARLDHIEQRMRAVVDHASEKSLDDGTTLADVLALSGRLGIGVQMLDAQNQVNANRLSRATEVQGMIAVHLQALIDLLSRLPEREMIRRLDNLRDVERRLSDLRDRQSNVSEQLAAIKDKELTAEARRQLEQIRQQQQAAQAEMEELADQLKKLQVDEASRSVQRAAEQLGQARQACAAGNPRQALDKTAAVDHQLEQAQKQLAEKLRENERAQQQRARSQLAAKVRTLWRSQQTVAELTILIDLDRRRDAVLDRTQAQRLSELLRQQQQLSTQTRELADEENTAPIYRFALSSAAGEMDRAGERLEQSQTDLATQQAQAAASRRLQHLLDALAAAQRSGEQDAPSSKQSPKKADGQKPPGNPPPGPSLSEIKLLRAMQDELNAETVALEQTMTDEGDLTVTQRLEYERLGKEQGQLADLVKTLLAKPDAGEAKLNEPPAPPDDEKPSAPMPDPPPFELAPPSLDPIPAP